MNAPQFTRPTKSEWAKKAAADLKTDQLSELLTWEPFKGVHAEAYHDASNKVPVAFTSYFHTLQRPPWHLLQQIQVSKSIKTANQQALNALHQGATGILFHANELQKDASGLFNGILPEHCQVSFAGEAADELAHLFVQTFNGKPLSGFVINGKKQHDTSTSFKSLGISLKSTHDIIPVLVDYLKTLDTFRRIFGDHFIDRLNVAVQLDQKYYQCVALLKAIRWLTHLYVHAEGLPTLSKDILIYSQVGLSGDYKKDLLTNTSIGVAAVTAGTNAISFDLKSEKGSLFDERISRNIGNLLRDESRLSTEQDPTAGSYFLDDLTHKISALAWNQYIAQS